MKPTLIQVPSYDNYSFRVSPETVPYLYNPFHYHAELELTYILKSDGTRFVGDHIERFKSGDLVLVGSNLPHCWKNDSQYFQRNSGLEAKIIVVHFKEDFAGPGFFQLSELAHIGQLIRDAKMGIKFYGKDKKKICEQLRKLVESQGAERLTTLIHILDLMAKAEKKEALCSFYSPSNLSSENIDRLNKIFEYSLERLNENITLKEVSNLVSLTPTSFCRYFKLHTRKTYRQFLNELKVAHICRLLQQTDMSIAHIAYDNGYNNLSHFVRTFKRMKGLKPLEYRRKIQGSMLEE